MAVWTTLARWSGLGCAVENAREASGELARMRREREAVALFLDEAARAASPLPEVAGAR